MASYLISTVYLTTVRGINGGDEMPGSRTTVTLSRWPDAAYAFRMAVYDATSDQGLRDTRAGHEAAYCARLATSGAMFKRDRDRTVVVGSKRVRIARTA